ncbi:MAG TPA: ABC transporter permease subunit, partial [Actinomycetota bacterium]|nr:ABC transporter permease subunit [Actinomycetota bacterium]
WIVNPLYGPLGWIVRAFGGTPGPVLLDGGGALATIAALSAFALGEGFLVMLATRREIPSMLYDAALVEGASRWRLFRGITFPLIAPTMALIAARDLLTSLQNALVPTILLTHGGPVGATKTLPYLIFERGFLESSPADGAAMAAYLFLGAFVLVAAVLVVRRMSSKDKAA